MPKTTVLDVESEDVLNNVSIDSKVLDISSIIDASFMITSTISPNPHSHNVNLDMSAVVKGVADARLTPIYIWMRVDDEITPVLNDTNDIVTAS